MHYRFSKGIQQWSRARKLRHFFSLCPPGSTVLDVGVTGQVEQGWKDSNYFTAHYDRDPLTYTGLGVEDMTQVCAQFPQFKFVRYGGRIFPFDDRQFDWAFSNAVIEHVGDSDAQLLFVNEMLRVAKNVFFTTPNRWFPVETHSQQLFRHWSRNRFDAWAQRKNLPWLRLSSLNLLSVSDLKSLLSKSVAEQWEIKPDPVHMTFTVVAH